MKIRKSNQECFPIDSSFQSNGVEYRKVVIPLAQPNKQGHMGVIQTVRVDNLVKGD